MRTLKTAAACVAAFLASAAAAETLPADPHLSLAQKLRVVSLQTEESITKLVLASADARLRSKIDNLTVQKPFLRTLPAFTMASAFTD